jgi:endo-alpha-N-acetylgalactosaminidase
VGVDEGGGGSASVIFIVQADGKQVFESPVMRTDSDPLPVDLDVSGVGELALILDPAGHPDWDQGNWLDPKFRKGVR